MGGRTSPDDEILDLATLSDYIGSLLQGSSVDIICGVLLREWEVVVDSESRSSATLARRAGEVYTDVR